MLLKRTATRGVALVVYSVPGTRGNLLYHIGEVVHCSVAVAYKQHFLGYFLSPGDLADNQAEA